MQQAVAGKRRAAYRIGLGFGLVAGVVGVAQWVFIARYVVEGWDTALAIRRRYPDSVDAGNIGRPTVFYWLGTAAWVAVATLVLYLLAAFTTAWVLQRRRDSLVAAWVAVAVSSAMYVVATIVALVTSPGATFIAGILPCELPLGLAFLSGALLLIPVGTSLGIHAGMYFSRSRQAL